MPRCASAKWRGHTTRRKIPSVSGNREYLAAIALSVFAVALSSMPYFIAPLIVPTGSEFTGFLLNPIDGFSYLAKMRQGSSQPFEFVLPYAVEAGPGALLFVFHLLLGSVSAFAGLPPLLTYHTARAIGATLMFGSSYLFFAQVFPTGRAKWAAFALVLFGSGLGWLALPFDLLSIDLWVPEAIPLLSTYANAHFPLATAALLFSVTLIVFKKVLIRGRLPLIFICGSLLAFTQPFSVAVMGAALGTWIVIEIVVQFRSGRQFEVRAWIDGLLALLLGAIAVLIYDWAAIGSHPMLQIWTRQNLTPSPSVLETLLGYSIVFLLAIVGTLIGGVRSQPAGRLMLVWALLNLVLLYSPFPLQRRLTLGLFVPLAGLAAAGLVAVAPTARRFAVLLGVALALSLPSHGIVVASGLFAASQGEPGFASSRDDRAIYDWIDVNLPSSVVVLAAPTSGSQLPAYTDVRVLYGHPFETPNADEQQKLVERLLRWSGDPEAGLELLRSAGVEYVVYGSEERHMGAPTWLGLVDMAYRAEAAELYKVPEA